jgi:hypothetical protein
MNQNTLVEKQEILQKQADEVLGRLDLISILSKYGKAKMIGSVALGLMTWPDIDIDLESNVGVNDKDYFKILKEIFGKKNIKQVMLIDNRDSFEKNRPESMYVGIVYDLDGVDWKIDIRYLNSSNAYAENNLKQIKAKLTNDKIKTILKIKTALHNHSNYRKEFSGHDIYNAVLDKDISSVEEFGDYLKVRGVGLL